MSQIVSYWDETLKKYVEVSTTTPLPTNAIGGGEGGAEEVEVTQPLPAGTNKIGNVGIDGALPAGTNTIGGVNIVSDDTAPTGFATTTATTTTTAAALPAQACKGALVQAASANTEPIMIGGQASQNWELEKGQQLPITATNLNQIYILSASGGQKLNVVYST